MLENKLIRASIITITLFCSINANSIGDGTTTICDLKDNKKAAYTFTTDDGIVNAVKSYNTDFKRLNLRGTMALIAGKITETGFSNWNFWNGIIADGHFDVTNHSMTHIRFSALSNSTSGQDSLINEIDGAQKLLKSKLPTQDVITMANPYVVNTASADVLIKQNHFAARNGWVGYNTLSPNDTEWYRLNYQSTYNYSTLRALTSNEMNDCLNYAVSNKKWLIILAHGIGSNRGEIPQDSITKHFEYVASRLDSIWCGTFNEVTKYIKEKQHANIVLKTNLATEIVVSVTHNLNVQIFNFPLTLKTQVPLNWKNVHFTQNGVTRILPTTIENGVRILYCDVVPNKGDITLHKH